MHVYTMIMLLADSFYYELNACLMSCHSSVNELLKIKDDLTKERDEQLSEIVRLRETLSQASQSQQQLEQDKAETEERITEVRAMSWFRLMLNPLNPGVPLLR